MPLKRKIALEPFSTNIYLCKGYSPPELKDKVLDTHLTLDLFPEQLLEVEAFALEPESSSEAITISDGKEVVIAFFKEEVESWAEVVELVSHELIHATYYIFKGRGIGIENDIAETYAYINGYLNKKCLPVVSRFYGYETCKE